MLRKCVLAILAVIFVCPLAALAQGDAAGTITVETELCTGIEERMPVGAADQFPADVGQVCLWSKVIGCIDETFIKHVWYYRGDEMSTVELPVRGTSWRTYSYKTIPAEWSGDWVVKIIDAGGNVLKAIPFKVGDGTAPKAKKVIKVEKPTETKEVKTENTTTPAAEDLAPAVEKAEDTTTAGH